MTENERTLARALNRCSFVPGTGTKRFARDMAFVADHHPEKELTPKQREYLRTAVIRFGKQIDAAVVALAFMPDMMPVAAILDPLGQQEHDRSGGDQ